MRSSKKEFIVRANEAAGFKKPRGVVVDLSDRIGEKSRVDIEYHVDDTDEFMWLSRVEHELHEEYDIWVRPI